MAESFISRNNDLYLFGPFRLNVGERRLLKHDTEIRLTAKTFDLLVILVKGAGHLQTRDALVSTLWPDTIVEEHSLTWNISALRRALGDEGDAPAYIETVRGQGYRFIAEVATASESDTRKEARKTTSRRRWMQIAAPLIVVAAISGLLIWYFGIRPDSTGVGRTPAQSIAVLPFENLSANRANAYFVRGIHDLILTKLAGLGELKVIARTSTKSYPSHPRDYARIANQLGVSNLLEGNVQQVGNRVLVNVRLVDARSGNYLWAQSYVRRYDHVLDIESDIAQNVAAALKLRLMPEESNRLKNILTKNPRVYDLYFQAEYFAAQIFAGTSANPGETAKHAIQLYRQAIKEDPEFARAFAQLSILESHIYWYHVDRSPERITDALRTAKRAIALNPALPAAHLALGYAYYYGSRDYAKALAEFRQVREAAPNNTEAIGGIAFIHRRRGQWSSALHELHKAEILDPRNPLWYYELGSTLAQLRRYDEAQAEFNHALSLAPKSYWVTGYKATVYLLSGNLKLAQKTLNSIPASINPRGAISAVRFKIDWLRRQPEQALKALDSVKSGWLAAPLMPGRIPASLFRAQALRLMNHPQKAQLAYEHALTLTENALREEPNNLNLLSLLALIQSGLGQESAALRSAMRTVKRIPISRDAMYGPSYLSALAVVYTQSGKAVSAVKILRHLLSIPAGLSISVPLLRFDPTWNPIRHNPGFQALLKQYAPKSHTPNPLTLTPASNATTTSAPQ